jgi:hypothetical protein
VRAHTSPHSDRIFDLYFGQPLLSSPSLGPRVNDDLDFFTNSISLGDWSKSDVCRGVAGDGIFIPISPGFGHLPSVLRLVAPEQIEYIRALVLAGILAPGRALVSHRHFFASGSKPRPIFDGRRINARSGVPPSFHMTTHAEFSALCSQFSYAAKFDFRSFYFNFKLHPDIRRFFGLRCSIGDFTWTRLPFGWSWSAFFAHSVAADLVAHLAAKGIVIAHYMDDVVIFGNSYEECLRSLRHAISFVESIGFRVKPSKTILPTQQLVIVGVLYDLAAKTSCMPKHYYSSLSTFLDSVESRGILSKAGFARIIGSLVFCNNAYPGSLSLLNPLFNFFNELFGSWRDPVPLLLAISLSRRVLSVFASLPTCRLQQSGGNVLIVHADATPSRIAAFVNGCHYAQPITPTIIFDAEACALDLALDVCNARNVELVTDNQPLFHAIVKGRSAGLSVNNLISRVLALRLQGHVIRVRWVPSENNPADFASRVDLNSEAARDVTLLPIAHRLNEFWFKY